MPVPAALVQAFDRECELRRQAGRELVSLIIDRDDDPRNLRFLIQRGGAASMIVIDALGGQSGATGRPGGDRPAGGSCELLSCDVPVIDLALCRIDLATIEESLVERLLGKLRARTRTGGMLYVYGGEPLDPRGVAALRVPQCESPTERVLFRLLVAAGWSVLRTSFRTDGAATAVAGRP